MFPVTVCISRKEEATAEGGTEIWAGGQWLNEESLVGSEGVGSGTRGGGIAG